MKEKLSIGLITAILASLVLSACGSSTGGDYGGKSPDYSSLKSAPPPLSGLYEQSNELLGGDLDAFQARVASLKGHPVVVNVWGSWCGPCRAEFPFFQQASANFGKKIAFLGVDSIDSEKAASGFLKEYPVPYPSYSDPDQNIWNDLGILGLPATAFYSADGELAYLKQGGYASLDDLEADIKNYTQ